ncbi:hypothetical protein RI367_002170 [Sorochytrium milnesiophthora]
MATGRYSGPTSFGDYPSTYPSTYADNTTMGYKPATSSGIVDAAANKAVNTLWWVKDTVAGTVANVAQPVVSTASQYGGIAFDTVRLYLNQYPLVRAFLYAFALFSAIPVAIFLGFAAITLTTCAVIATVVVGTVEAGVLGFGLLCLSPFLFFSFWGTVFAVGIYYAAFYGLRLTSQGINTAQNVTGLQAGTGVIGSAAGVAKNVAATGANLMQKGETLVVGSEGQPTTLANRA